MRALTWADLALDENFLLNSELEVFQPSIGVRFAVGAGRLRGSRLRGLSSRPGRSILLGVERSILSETKDHIDMKQSPQCQHAEPWILRFGQILNLLLQMPHQKLSFC